MASDRPREPGPYDLVVPFVFVPHGAPEPTDWMADHPGWVKFPATMIVRGPAGATDRTTSLPAATAGSAAAATPEAGTMVDGIGEAFAQFLGAAMAEAVATMAAAGTVLLYPSQTAPREIDEAHPYSGRDPERDTTEGLRQSPPIPALPGLAPPSTLPPPQGISPTPPLPSSSGGAPAAPLPGLPPTRPVHEAGPTVFQQDRNEGLKSGLRTNSQRARDAARKADPGVPHRPCRTPNGGRII